MLWRGRRVFVPAALRKKALTLAHAAHQGIVRSKQRLRASLFWPAMDSDIEQFCRNCETCVRLQPLQRDTPLKPTPLPENSWEKCAIDLVGPFPGQVYVMTLVDYRSKWPEAVILTSPSSQQVIKALTEMFARFGNPKEVVTDNGSQFTLQEFECFLTSNGIQHNKSSPYYPRANGEVERFHRYLNHGLKAAEIDGISWKQALPGILQVYRSTPHAGTGVSPAKIIFGREIRTKLPVPTEDEVKVEPEQRYHLYQKKMKEYTDKKRRARRQDFEVGEVVFIANRQMSKLSARFGEDRYVIIRKLAENTCELVHVNTGKLYVRNGKFLRRAPQTTAQTSELEEAVDSDAEENNTSEALEENFSDVAGDPPDGMAPGLKTQQRGEVQPRRSSREQKPNKLPDYIYH